MQKLNITIAVIMAMALLVCLAPFMAVSTDSQWYTHFTYPLGHANYLHWLINGWALLVLHNLFKPTRMIVAYSLAVCYSFSPAMTLLDSPLIGSSVITCFFFGFYTPYLRKRDKLSAFMMLAILLIGFFIPGIAALPHLVMYVAGIAWFYIEREYMLFMSFCK